MSERHTAGSVCEFNAAWFPCRCLHLQGIKWSIRSLRTYMTARHGAEPSNELFHNIQNLIIRCLLAVQVG